MFRCFFLLPARLGLIKTNDWQVVGGGWAARDEHKVIEVIKQQLLQGLYLSKKMKTSSLIQT